MPHEVKYIEVTLVQQNGIRNPATISAVELLQFVQSGRVKVVHKGTGFVFNLEEAQRSLNILQSQHEGAPPPPTPTPTPEPEIIPTPTDTTIQFLPNLQLNADRRVTGTVRTVKAGTWKNEFNNTAIDLVLQFTNQQGGVTRLIHQESFIFGDRSFIDHQIITNVIPNIISGVVMEGILLSRQGQPFSIRILKSLQIKEPTPDPDPTPTKQSNSFEVIFLNNAGFNFSSNVSLADFERLSQEANKDIRWRIRGQEVNINPQFTFEQVIRTIDDILKQIEENEPEPDPDPDPMPTKGDIFQTAIVGLIGLGVVLGLTNRGDKKR